MRRQLIIAASATMFLGLSACGSEDGGGDPVVGYTDTTDANDPLAPLGDPVITETIMDIVGANPELSMLVAAIKTAGLDKTLEGKGPFTIFAPTNIGFEKEGTEAINPVGPPVAEDEDATIETLKPVLTYHVVAGKLMEKDLAKLASDGGGVARIKTVQGAELTIRDQSGTLALVDISGAAVSFTLTDVEGSNGVVHTIDTVLKPQK